MIGQVADHLDEALVEPDLLARLAQRRRLFAAVGRIDPTAREADLSGVIAQLGGALREKHRQLIAFNERNQYCCRHGLAREKFPVGIAAGLP